MFFGSLRIWNAVNDPLLGWLSDKSSMKFKRRRFAIRLGGFLWAAAFVITWFPPWKGNAWSGLYFLFAICCYDGMLTYVEVNHNAFLAEITVSASERASFHMWNAIGSAVGSFSSLAVHHYWDVENARKFQLVCLGIGILAALTFEFSASFVVRNTGDRAGGREHSIEEEREEDANGKEDATVSQEVGFRGYSLFVKQVSLEVLPADTLLLPLPALL